MATLQAKADSFINPQEFIEWAKAVDVHEDVIITERLKALNTSIGQSECKLMLYYYIYI